MAGKTTRRGDVAASTSALVSGREPSAESDDERREARYRFALVTKEEEMNAAIVVVLRHLIRSAALIVVADVVVWTVTSFAGDVAPTLQSLLAFSTISATYYGMYVARWNRSLFDAMTRTITAATVGSCVVIFGNAMALRVVPRSLADVVFIVIVSTLSSLFGVYATDLRLHSVTTRRSPMRLLADSTLHGTWCSVAGIVCWAYAFSELIPTLTFVDTCAWSSLIAFVFSAALRWLRAMHVLYTVDHWIIRTIMTKTQKVSERITRSMPSFVTDVDVLSSANVPRAAERPESSIELLRSARIMPIFTEPQAEVQQEVVAEDITDEPTSLPVIEDATSDTHDNTHETDDGLAEWSVPRRIVYAPPFTVVRELSASMIASSSASTKSVDEPSSIQCRRRVRKRQYRRRRTATDRNIDMSQIVSSEIDIALNIGVSIEAELERVLERRQARLAELKNQNANPVSIAQVEADVSAIRAELRRASSTRERFQSAQTSYESDLEIWMESIRAAAAVSRLDYAIDKLKSASVKDDPQIKDLIDQRAVWGLRLVSSQIFTIVELQDSLYTGKKRSSVVIADLRANIETLERKLSQLQEQEINSGCKREELEARLLSITSELDTVRERERIALEDWRKERVKLEIELEASVKELQTATRTVDEALKAKMDLLAELQSAEEKSESDAQIIQRLEHETRTLQAKLQSLSAQLSDANASIEQINGRRSDLEAELQIKVAELEAALSHDAADSLVEDLKREVDSLNVELNMLREQRAAEMSDVELLLRKQLAEAQEQLEAQRVELKREAQAEIDALNNEMDSIRKEMEQLATEMSDKTRQGLDYRKQVEERQSEIKTLKRCEESASRALADSKAKLAQVEEELEAKQRVLQERIELAANQTELESKLADSEAELERVRRDLSSLKNERDSIEIELERVLSDELPEVEHLRSRLASVESERDVLRTELSDAMSRQVASLSDFDAQRGALEEQLAARDSKLERVRAELIESHASGESRSARIAELESERASLQSELDALASKLSDVEASQVASLSDSDAQRAALEAQLAARDAEL